MAVVNPLRQYQEQAVNTATPGMLVIMLFDGAIKNIKLAINAIEKKDIEGAHNAIVKTENIYMCLVNDLNESIPISESLKKLYDYLIRQLMEANAKKDIKILNEVLEFTSEFRDTWREAEKNYHAQIKARK